MQIVRRRDLYRALCVHAAAVVAALALVELALA